MDRSTNPSDGYLDQLHTIRDQYGADLVTLLVSEGTERWVESPIPCPIHPLILKIVDLMLWSWIRLELRVTVCSMKLGTTWVVTHNREDAMNRGIPDTDPSNNSIFKAFNYGKRWIVDGQGYRTIMAYDTEDSSTYNNRIPYFSNPLIQYQGVTTGNLNSEDNAQVLSVTPMWPISVNRSFRESFHRFMH